MKYTKNLTLIGFIILNLTISCKQDIDEKMKQENLNHFEMMVNGQSWTPTIIDPCHQTYTCSMSSLNEDNYCNIEAYKDPLATTNHSSENYFEIQVMKVNRTGNFAMNGEFEDFGNYTRLTLNNLNERKIYQNKKNGNAFNINIKELFSSPNTLVVGIRGSFSGILYNIENPLDSMIISKGEFIFKKTNRYNFNQCKE